MVVVIKEFMIYMIINLSRVYAGFFETTLSLIQKRVQKGQNAHNMVYKIEDIDYAKSILDKNSR